MEESTNVVKSNNKKTKLILAVSYLVIWAVAMIAFWVFGGSMDAMGYSLAFLWVILPVATLVISFFIGKNDCWGKYKWLSALAMGIMYMLAEYGTFSMANNLEFSKVNAPEWGMIITGAIVSIIGLAIGHMVYKRKK